MPASAIVSSDMRSRRYRPAARRRSVCSIASLSVGRRQQRLVHGVGASPSDEAQVEAADAGRRPQVGDGLVEDRQHLRDFVALVVEVARRASRRALPRRFDDRQPLAGSLVVRHVVQRLRDLVRSAARSAVSAMSRQ